MWQYATRYCSNLTDERHRCLGAMRALNEALRVRRSAGWSPKLLPLSKRSKPMTGSLLGGKRWDNLKNTISRYTSAIGVKTTGKTQQQFSANKSESSQNTRPAEEGRHTLVKLKKKRECHPAVNTSCQEGSTSSILEQPGPFLRFRQANTVWHFDFSICVPFIQTATLHRRTAACSKTKLSKLCGNSVNYRSGKLNICMYRHM